MSYIVQNNEFKFASNHNDLTTIKSVSTDSLVAIAAGGTIAALSTSSDNGVTFNNITVVPNILAINSDVASTADLASVYITSANKIYKVVDNASSLILEIGAGATIPAISCSLDGAEIYAAVNESGSGSVIKSTDYGNSFTKIFSLSNTCVSIDFHGSYVFIVCDNITMVSYNNGTTWAQIPTNLVFTQVVCSDTHVYFSNRSEKYYVSDNNGITISESISDSAYVIDYLTVSPDNLTTFIFNEFSDIFRADPVEIGLLVKTGNAYNEPSAVRQYVEQWEDISEAYVKVNNKWVRMWDNTGE